MKTNSLSRRELLQLTTHLGIVVFFQSIFPSYSLGKTKTSSGKDFSETSDEIDITIGKLPLEVNGKRRHAIAMNGSVPGPIIRLHEGREAVLRVKNTLDEVTSIHWHGLILPQPMDGVPGVSFAGIKPGETFTYRFPVVQSGTYWCHSHSSGQEQLGLYAPLIIEPKEKDPNPSDRDYVILLSDWSFLDPMDIIAKLKKQGGYFNNQRLTVGDFIQSASKNGFSSALLDRLNWMKMRMDSTDILDVTGATYSYLANGRTAESSWQGIFKKGEKIRLRFINGAAMTIFDVRIPGLKMNVIQADGINVQPVSVDEFRFGPGETYDVIVEPVEEKVYAIFAEAMDRSGCALATLSPKEGLRPEIPKLRERPSRTMADMGMAMQGMKGHEGMSGMESKDSMKGMKHTQMSDSDMSMPGHDMSQMNSSKDNSSPIPGKDPVQHGPDTHGPGNSFVPEETKSRLHEPGTGLEDNGRKVLVYTDLKSRDKIEDRRVPAREIEIHLTGNMDRFMWSIDGKKYSEDSEPILFHYGERVRLTIVNDTMMEHPMHLHGMFMDLENGAGTYLPKKHTILVKPAERVSLAITADALGDWAFHCHMLYHMELGMFRVVRVAKKSSEAKS